METRKLAALLVTLFNEVVEKIEGAMSADDDEDEKPDRTEKKGSKEGDVTPGKDDIADAARAAIKVLERKDVIRIIKKHGKADRASEVKPELRQAVMDALQEAIDEV